MAVLVADEILAKPNHQLDSERNEFVPVYRLPPELLAKIFSFAIDGIQHDISWVNFTYVSWRWRSVALDTPHLWTTPEFRYLKWAATMLYRSKTSDLVVQSKLSSLPSSNLAYMKKVLVEHASRIRTISLTGITAQKLSALVGGTWASHSSLQLKSLRLISDASEHPPTFPITIMAADTKHLCSLETVGCSITLWTKSFPHLTRLKIHSTVNRPSHFEFVMLLQRMPALKVLDMHDSLPLGSEDSTTTTASCARLTQLKALHLSSTENLYEIANVLVLLVVPSKTHIILEHLPYRYNRRGLTSKPSVLATSLATFFSTMCYEGFEATSFSHLSVKENAFSINFMAWKIDRELDVRCGPPDQLYFQLHLTHHSCAEALVREIFFSLPLQNLLTLSMQLNATDETLQKTFGGLTQLRNVQFRGSCALKSFNKVMRPIDNYSAIPFPALQVLSIQQCGDHPRLKLTTKDLYDYGRARPRLEKLTIFKCPCIDKMVMERFQEACIDFELKEDRQERV